MWRVSGEIVCVCEVRGEEKRKRVYACSWLFRRGHDSDPIQFNSISTHTKTHIECWRCAKFLTSLLERLGASVKMVRAHTHMIHVSVSMHANALNKPHEQRQQQQQQVSLVEGRSPVVLARFGSDPSKPTVTLYG